MPNKTRLTQKENPPTQADIRNFIGEDSCLRLARFEELLQERYDLTRVLKFPFGNEYGWGFRYSHKKALLLYVFFEQGGFCCTISINDKGAPKVEAILGELLPATQSLWQSRYPCGEFGGWVHYSVETDDALPDIVRLIGVKVKGRN
ncbi:MAG: DUF3788 domain-containing protein [Oscillospiraceae bacterium]|jgi:hypothetical protein|nr:DUF3788 domain-containing protein [Oscillospiraceae bacterium]